MSRVSAFIDRVVRQRRPRRFLAAPEDAAVMRMAIELRAAAGPPAEPTAEFTERLHRELAGQLGGPSAGPQPAGQEAAAARPAAPGPLSTRRGLVRAAGLAAAAGGAGLAGGYLLQGGGPGEAAPSGPRVLRPATGSWQTVARTGDLPEGGVTAFDTGTVLGFVGRSGGRLFAVSGVCTHLGCRLTLDGPARELRCPCHTAAFSLTGAVLHHPRVGPLPALPRIPVRETAGTVQVFTATAAR